MNAVLSTQVTLTAPAELCASTARLWRARQAKELREHHDEAYVHIPNTRSIDSSGLGALISVNKIMRARGGTLKILNPTAAVIQIIELTRLHRVLEIIHA